MAARRPFWKWHRWKSIGFCLWPPSTCIWNLKFKFQSKLDLCSGNHVVYRQTDGRTDGQTDKVNPVYPPSKFVGRGYNKAHIIVSWHNPKQCQMGHTSDLMMITRPSTCILKIIRDIDKLNTHKPIYCIKDNWKNWLNLRHTLDRMCHVSWH